MVLITLIAGIITSCNGNGNDNGNDDGGNFTQQKAEERHSKWEYKTGTDPMTDEVLNLAFLFSENSHIINGRETFLEVAILHSNGVTSVAFELPDGCKFRSFLPHLEYRIDDGEVIGQAYSVIRGHIICIGSDKGEEFNWVKKLKSSKKLACKIELADGSIYTYEFDTRGLQWEH